MGTKLVAKEVKVKNFKKCLYILPFFMLMTNSVYAASGSAFIEKFFSNDYIFTILLIIAIVGAVLEILTPGFGLGGIISIAAFVLFFWGNIARGNTNWFEILLFVLGLLLLGFEILIPGFGVAGISGILAIAVAIVLSMEDIYFAIFSLAIALVIAIVLGIALVKRGINSELINRLRLFTESSSEKGYVGVKSEEVKLGDVLITKTALRPTGYAIFHEEKIEVISDVGFIGKDEEVRVVRISGARVFVEKNI